MYILSSSLEFGFNFMLLFILSSTQETYYAYAEVDYTSYSALAGISDLISRLHARTLTANTQWGELSRSETGEKIKDDFIGDFRDFCEFLNSE